MWTCDLRHGTCGLRHEMKTGRQRSHSTRERTRRIYDGCAGESIIDLVRISTDKNVMATRIDIERRRQADEHAQRRRVRLE